jgi:hypothetical protein
MQKKAASFLRLKITNFMLLTMKMHGYMLTSYFGMWSLVRWIDPNHMIVKVFMVVVTCVNFLFIFHKDPTLIQFHNISCFCVVVSIGFVMRVVKMNSMFIHGHWKGWNLLIMWMPGIWCLTQWENRKWYWWHEWIDDVVCVQDNVVVIVDNVGGGGGALIKKIENTWVEI